ncbi:MAG: AraC family transcriptional regulator ligand-binding domain-containing protein [Burkholderiaceae bacterium]|nr:AraC family transcriptional regulator ligand-binding domain-containing protein [Burkholderiaceae bacterium]
MASTVSAGQELTVASNLLRDEPGVGLQVGLSYHLSAYGILGYGLMSSATGADALALARRFLPLTYAFTSIAHRRNGRFDELAFEPPDELAPTLQRFVVERAMGATSRLVRDVLGGGFELTGFELRHAESPSGPQRRTPARVLGARVRYGGAANALSFAHEQLLQPLPQANAATAAMCERMCVDLLARRKTRLDTAAFVREHLASLPAGQAPELAEVAKLLNTSERTLKRRLQQEGASFRAISNAVRHAKAEQLIAEGRLSMTDIAAELGFSDLSSFSQAFKRWSGAAPTASDRALR